MAVTPNRKSDEGAPRERRFDVDEFRAMAEAGILDRDEHLELIRGRICHRDPEPNGPDQRRFTVDEYHAMAEAGILGADERVELIEGRVYEMTPIGSERASHVKKVSFLLRDLEPDRALIGVQDPIRLGDESEPEPDVSVLAPRENFYRDAHPTSEDVYLLVEIADTTALHDCTVKLPSYAAYDVPVVWLLTIEDESLEVYESPEDGEYTSIRTPPMDASLPVPGVDGFDVRVGDLFVRE